jgi:hypothetical protein
VANAEICPQGKHLPFRGFIDAFDVDFVGVFTAMDQEDRDRRG